MGCPKILGDKLGYLPPVGGPRPQTRNFTFRDRNFFYQVRISTYLLNRQRMVPPTVVQNFEKIYRVNFEKLGFENFGGVALFGYHPLAAPPCENFLHRPLEGDELWKMSFTACRYLLPVRSYGELKFSKNTHLGAKNLENWSSKFPPKSIVDRMWDVL